LADTRFTWPEGCAGAISLTFDDGMASQLAIAVPRLNEFGLGGTFYLNPRDDYVEQLAPWREVLAAGHELGNHSINHICAYNHIADPCAGARVLEEQSEADMDYEVGEATRRLRTLFPEQRDTSYAYPCYQSFIGYGAGRQSYVPVVARHCIAGRGLGEIPLSNAPLWCDLAYLWAWPCERKTAAELIGLAEQTAAQGRWGILVFHGVNTGHLPIAEVDLVGLCAYLARQRGRIWSAPVATVARWVLDQRAALGQELPLTNDLRTHSGGRVTSELS
jgi:peptidoglycan-N-acetylglucosamine deacetylase